MFKKIKNKLLEEIGNVDVNRPTGRCNICGHETYMISGSITEDVCVHCKIMRKLVPLKLPVEIIRMLFDWVDEKLNNKDNLKIK